jgi:perosamine synthetase
VSVDAQLPVYSPLSFGALRAGYCAMAGWSSAGARQRLEQAMQQALGCRGMLLTDSGTTALRLALQGATTGPARSVALPAYACYDIATAADGAGVQFMLYDVDPHTLSPDLGSLERALEAGVGVVVVAHQYGIPADLPAVRALLTRFGAILVEDAAQGSGVVVEGRPAGASGRFGVLSFGRGKGLTGGGGGALIANEAGDESFLAQSAVGLGRSRRGWSEAVKLTLQWLLGRREVFGAVSSIPGIGLGETRYRPVTAPAAVADFSVGVLSRTLPLDVSEAAQRRTNAGRLIRHLGGGGAVKIASRSGHDAPGYLRLPVLVPPGARARFASAEARRLGVMPGYPLSLADLPGFAPRGLNAAGEFPGARTLASSLFTLPTHSRLREIDLERMEEWLRRTG